MHTRRLIWPLAGRCSCGPLVAKCLGTRARQVPRNRPEPLRHRSQQDGPMCFPTLGCLRALRLPNSAAAIINPKVKRYDKTVISTGHHDCLLVHERLRNDTHQHQGGPAGMIRRSGFHIS